MKCYEERFDIVVGGRYALRGGGTCTISRDRENGLNWNYRYLSNDVTDDPAWVMTYNDNGEASRGSGQFDIVRRLDKESAQ